MSILGWLFLLLSWGLIIWLCIFCFLRIFRIEKESIVAPLEIEAEIEEEEERGEKLHPAAEKPPEVKMQNNHN